jgi:hypothetical protein
VTPAEEKAIKDNLRKLSYREVTLLIFDPATRGTGVDDLALAEVERRDREGVR